MNVDVYFKYLNDLKNKFKINEDNNSIKLWESFHNELIFKINHYKHQSKNADHENTIERIKLIINRKEIGIEKVILRECEITADRLYFLIAKKTFDFRNISVTIYIY
jgi:hypothetical protein